MNNKQIKYPFDCPNPTFTAAEGYRHYFRLLLDRVTPMLEFSGLPDSVDENYLKYCLFLLGRACFFEKNGKVYALDGQFSGEPNEYYLPINYVVANPRLGSMTLGVNKNCVIVPLTNSDITAWRNGIIGVPWYFGGLYSLISRTAQLLSNSDLTMFTTLRNMRLVGFATAKTQAQKMELEKIFADMYEGTSKLVVTDDIINNITVNPIASAATQNALLENIEAHQYILANFWHTIGLNSNYNMKRERMISAELSANESSLSVSIDSIFKNVSEGLERVNEMFGLNCSVRLGNAWIAQTASEDEQEEPEEDEPTIEGGETDVDDSSGVE